MKRFPQYRLRTVLLLTAAVSVLCGLAAARMETVQAYNRGHFTAVQGVDVVLLTRSAAPTSFGGRENYASLFSRGRLFMDLTDDETFQMEITCRESQVLFGGPVVTVATFDSIGNRPLDAGRNRELREAIVQRLKLAGVAVTAQAN